MGTVVDDPLGKVSRRKVAVLLEFVQMRGEGSDQFFLSNFHKCIFGQLKETISSIMPII